MARRRRAAGQSYHRLGVLVCDLPGPTATGLVLQHPGQPFLSIAVANPLDCVRSHVQDIGDFLLGASLIAQQQNSAPPQYPGLALTPFQQPFHIPLVFPLDFQSKASHNTQTIDQFRKITYNFMT
jgi:hypothetical protein